MKAGCSIIALFIAAMPAAAQDPWNPSAGQAPVLPQRSCGAIVGVGDGDHLFVLLGPRPLVVGGTGPFYRYSTSTGEWEPRAGLPLAHEAACLVHDGGDFLYAFNGSNYSFFWRYSISGSGPWTEMAPLPQFFHVAFGASLAFVPPDRIYALSADANKPLCRFHPPDGDNPKGRWDLEVDLPAFGRFGTGCSMAYPGQGDLLYVMIGGGTLFRTYRMSTQTWETAADVPASPGRDAQLFFQGDRLFAFRGGNTPDFWTYSISGNLWTVRESAPGAPRASQSLAWPGSGARLFALEGPTGALWSYDLAAANAAPTMNTLRQYRQDGVAPIAPGGRGREQSVVLTAVGADPDADPLRLEVEVVPAGAAYSGVPTAASPEGPAGPLSVVVAGLRWDQPYHWRARTVDALGAAAPWSDFDSASQTHFVLHPNEAPLAASSIRIVSSTGASIEAGQEAIVGPIRIEAMVNDPDGDPVFLQGELRPVDEPFTGMAGVSSPLAPSGSTASLMVVLHPGRYRLSVRTRDDSGATRGWSEFGDNDTGAADLLVLSAGSTGGSGCGQAGPGSGTPAALLFLMAAAAALLRRDSGAGL